MRRNFECALKTSFIANVGWMRVGQGIRGRRRRGVKRGFGEVVGKCVESLEVGAELVLIAGL